MRHVPTNTFKLFDIKTSRNGWKQNAKSDAMKSAQLIAYKNYFAEQFGVPIEKIEVEFFIVKRKIVEESMFPQKRIQNHKPAAGSVTQKKFSVKLNHLLMHCFDSEGTKNADRNYVAVAGKGAKLIANIVHLKLIMNVVLKKIGFVNKIHYNKI
jgi:hypothetical protein